MELGGGGSEVGCLSICRGEWSATDSREAVFQSNCFFYRIFSMRLIVLVLTLSAFVLLAVHSTGFDLSISNDEETFAEGMDAYENRDFELAIALLTPLAEDGHAEAQEQLALTMWLIGLGYDLGNIRTREWNALLKQAGIRKHVIYDLRHTFCTALIHSSVPLLTISTMMGHKSVQFTQNVYGHLFEDSQQVAVDAIKEFIHVGNDA